MPKGLRGKLFVAYIIVTLLVAVVVAYNLYIRYDSRLSSIQEENLLNARITSNSFLSYIKDISNHQNIIAKDSLKDGHDFREEDLDLIKDDGVSDIFVINKNNNVVVSSNHDILLGIDKIPKNNEKIGNVQKWNGILAFSITTKFKFNDKEYRCISFVPLNIFRKIIPLTIYKEYDVLITDAKGSLAFDSCIKDIKEIKSITGLNKKHIDNSNTTYDSNGSIMKDQIGILTPLKEHGWSIGSFQESNTAMYPARVALIQNILMLLPGFIMIFFLGVYFTNKLVKPLSNLSFQAGNLIDSLDTSIKTETETKEISILATSLEHLRKNIKNKIDELKEKNQHLQTIEDLTFQLQENLSLNACMKNIVKATTLITNSSCSILSIVDTKKYNLYLSKDYNAPVGLKNNIVDNNIIHKSIDSVKNELIFNDCSSCLKETGNPLIKEGFNSVAIFKMKIVKDLVAVLEVFSEEKGHFNQGIIKLLNQITKPLALALKNAILHRNQKNASNFSNSIINDLPVATIVISCPDHIIMKENELFKNYCLKKDIIGKNIFDLSSKSKVFKFITENLHVEKPFFIKNKKIDDKFWDINIIPTKENKNITKLVVTIQESTEEVKMRLNLQKLFVKQKKHALELEENLSKRKEWQEKLKILNKSTLTISKMNNIAKILEIAAKTAKDLTDSKLVSIFTLSKDQKRVKDNYIGIPMNYKTECMADSSKFNVSFHGGLYSKCLREGVPQIINDIENYPEKKELPEGHLPLKGLLILPLLSNSGKVMGLLCLSDKKNNKKFTVEDCNIAHSLAVHTAVALTNAYSYEKEKKISHLLQRSLLPILPKHQEIEFDYAYEAATDGAMVGGDFFDVIELKDGKLGVVIADVAGKGIEAATITSTIKNTLRAFALENLSPGDILTRVNKSIYNQSISNFVTCAIGILDLSIGKLAYAIAGHHPPILYKDRLGNGIILQTGSTPLGVIKDEIYEDFTADINPLDTILFYTDGLVEARKSKELYGTDRLMKAVLKHCHHRRPVRYLIQDVEKFSNKRFHDDIAVLSVKILNLTKERGQLNLRLGRLFSN